MSNNQSYIIEIAPDDTFTLILPDDSIRDADNLEEIFDAIREFHTYELAPDENLFKL